MRTEEEILKQIYLSIEKDGELHGKSYEQVKKMEICMVSHTYEQGVQDALNWVIGNYDDAPIEND